MTPQDFCYWLQGFAELGGEVPAPEQWKAIKDHLDLAFTKVTPPLWIPSIPSVTPSYPGYPVVTCSTSGKSVDQPESTISLQC